MFKKGKARIANPRQRGDCKSDQRGYIKGVYGLEKGVNITKNMALKSTRNVMNKLPTSTQRSLIKNNIPQSMRSLQNRHIDVSGTMMGEKFLNPKNWQFWYNAANNAGKLKP